jgi:hypothetical protein
VSNVIKRGCFEKPKAVKTPTQPTVGLEFPIPTANSFCLVKNHWLGLHAWMPLIGVMGSGEGASAQDTQSVA